MPSVNARSLDPDAPLDDLAGLRGIVGDARVVAIGESAHYVPEFHLVRHRLLRFLAERLGFSAYALEAPFTAGRVIGDWIESGSGDIGAIAATAMPIRLGRVPELHDTLRWMRANGGLRLGVNALEGAADAFESRHAGAARARHIVVEDHAYVLPDGKGRAEVVHDLTTLWGEAERLAGRPLDPLDPALVAALRRG